MNAHDDPLFDLPMRLHARAWLARYNFLNFFIRGVREIVLEQKIAFIINEGTSIGH